VKLIAMTVLVLGAAALYGQGKKTAPRTTQPAWEPPAPVYGKGADALARAADRYFDE